MVNEFSAGEFMETHYHSQFDSEAFYDEGVYRFHHQLYGSLVIALDHLAAAPLDFERVFYALQSSVDPQIAGQAAAWAGQDRGLGRTGSRRTGTLRGGRRQIWNFVPGNCKGHRGGRKPAKGTVDSKCQIQGLPGGGR